MEQYEWIEVGLASDQRYFAGLMVTVVSICVFSSDNSCIRINIITTDIDIDSRKKLEKISKRYKKCVTFNWIEINEDIFEDMPDFFFESKLTYARLLFPEVLNYNKIIYIDSDILFLKNIAELWDIKLGKFPLAAVKDQSVGSFKETFPRWKKFNINENSPEFNAGILVMNLKLFRKENIHKKAMHLLSCYPEDFPYHDQTVLNCLLNGRIMELEKSWNFMTNHFNSKKHLELLRRHAINLHYVTNKKPWIFCIKNLPDDFFRFFAKSVGIKLVSRNLLVSCIKNSIWRLFPGLLKLRYYIGSKAAVLVGNDIKSIFFNDQLKKVGVGDGGFDCDYADVLEKYSLVKKEISLYLKDKSHGA